eukprot:CAMPEP_0178985410 /NCGR_PEP_ID=MMETSP0795-20121207/2137_1 /TAXON_ID=88552 /ORGANISM="Amoebophrya sp., Strain Ameob2" /LENGTH=114 /DNA_ID=CAMNT_0020676365 /DNA_START=273 /DNA_END=615 /DNA_ORIENTATION=-
MSALVFCWLSCSCWLIRAMLFSTRMSVISTWQVKDTAQPSSETTGYHTPAAEASASRRAGSPVSRFDAVAVARNAAACGLFDGDALAAAWGATTCVTAAGDGGVVPPPPVAVVL